jgi:hypothetical protein
LKGFQYRVNRCRVQLDNFNLGFISKNWLVFMAVCQVKRLSTKSRPQGHRRRTRPKTSLGGISISVQ